MGLDIEHSPLGSSEPEPVGFAGDPVAMAIEEATRHELDATWTSLLQLQSGLRYFSEAALVGCNPVGSRTVGEYRSYCARGSFDGNQTRSVKLLGQFDDQTNLQEALMFVTDQMDATDDARWTLDSSSADPEVRSRTATGKSPVYRTKRVH